MAASLHTCREGRMVSGRGRGRGKEGQGRGSGRGEGGGGEGGTRTEGVEYLGGGVTPHL